MNIYVGNLSYEATEEDLQQAFEAFGQVESVNITKNRYSGESKGFGFVEMPAKCEAQSAIEGLNGKEMKGRTLRLVRLGLAPKPVEVEEDGVVSKARSGRSIQEKKRY